MNEVVLALVGPEAIAARLEAVRAAVPSRRIEIFVRAAERRRVGGEGRASAIGEVVERGVAVRVGGGQGRLAGFAATTSDDRPALVDLARAAAGRVAPAVVPILALAGTLSDDGEPPPIPAVEALERWRRDLVSRIEDVAGPILRVTEATVEVASIAEAIATGDGRVGRRFRRRAWGMVEVLARGRAAECRRTFVRAVPGDDGLPILDGLEGWAAALAARVSRKSAGPPELPWRLAPAAAGTLVRALAHALHTGEPVADFPVGPGWRLSDDPGAPDALAGGRFDDVGAPTGVTTLADGATGRRAIGGPGHVWRPSFRDIPLARPAHLVVRNGDDPPTRSIEVVDLRILPFDGGEWVFEGLARFPDGSGGEVRRRMSPGLAVRSCRAAVGDVVATADGVSTPALVLDAPAEVSRRA